MRSGPFCQSNRPMKPSNGTSSLSGKPISRCNALLHSNLPLKSNMEYGAAQSLSSLGFHSSKSMPFAMPFNRCARAANKPSKPLPPSGVVISYAYPSETVKTRSDVAIAPFKILTTLPSSNSCARIHSGYWYSKALYHSPGTPKFGKVVLGSTPWCAML